MPTKTYARKLDTAGALGNIKIGEPSLLEGIVLAGRTWRVTADASNVTIMVDGSALTQAEIDELDAAHAAWSPDIPLADYQQQVIAAIDGETGLRIGQGFEYPASSGNFFSMSSNAQLNWLGLEAKAALLSYPYTIRTIDDVLSYDVVDEADAHAVVDAAFVKKETCLTLGRMVKTAVLAATTYADVDAAAASWLSGGPP